MLPDTAPLMLLVDGSSYLYRAFHAMPDLRSAQGFPTGALHGMVAMLKRLREQYPAEHAVCVFDASGPTFRDALFPEYKGHRAPMPEALAQQIEPIHAVVRLLGWPVLCVPGVEADDVIGTVARVAAEQGHRVVISTGDKDLAQLVTDRVSLVNTMTQETLDVEGVRAKFGVPPDRIVDYLALMGDAVDNVPGVEKVGPKTAAKWISEFGSLDGVMAGAVTIKGVAGDNLRKALDWLPTGRQLVTVKCDCDLSADVAGWPMASALDALALRAVDADGLEAFFRQYGFRTWLKELQSSLGRPTDGDAMPSRAGASATALPASHAVDGAPAVDAVPPLPETVRYETVLTEDQFAHWLDRIRAAPLVAFDTETDSLDPLRARLVGLSFSVAVGEAAYVPLAHDYPAAPAQLSVGWVLERLRPWLEDPQAFKVGQNIKYDLHVMANAGIQVQGYVHDTLLQSYVWEAHRPHSLESLAERHLRRKGLSYEDLCGKGAHQIPFSQVDIEQASRYSCEDSDMTLHVHQVLWRRLEAEPGLRYVYSAIEMPCSLILQRMERHGVLVDPAVLQQQSQSLAERILALEQQAYGMAGQPFNLGSPKQIGDILFNRLGLPVKKKTATGAPSTDEEVLQELAVDYPLPATLLEHRSLSKLKSTYTDKLPTMVRPETGRVHTSYQQAVAVTGRLSSNDPNLQNIPIRTAEGRRIREAFIAPPGHVLMSADYSQIELRIMAHISEDPVLLRAFADGVDVHRATASEVFSVPVEAVTGEQRRYAKVINFGLIYGMGAFGLASNLGIDQKAARAFIDRYFTRFAGVKRYMDDTRTSAAERGWVETVFGRRLELPEIRGGSGPRRAAAERQAINAPMQGTAADLIKLAMIAVQDVIDREQRATRMVMQVHDELVLEVPEAERAWAREAIPRCMAQVAQLRVPLLAEVGEGLNWDQAH